jgi:RNA recognition motif-containing protein
MNFLSADSMSANRTLYVGNISLSCNEQDIQNLFLPFGSLLSLHIKKNTQGRLSYCFVKFAERSSAEQALVHMNGQLVHGRTLRIGWADEYDTGGAKLASTGKAMKNIQPPTAQIHIAFHANNWNPVTEEFLRGVFERFGRVVDICVKQTQFHRVSIPFMFFLSYYN